MILEGVYRRFVALKGGKAPLDARFTHQESLAVAQVEPEGFEFTRAGRRFRSAFNGTGPTGIAPVQAMGQLKHWSAQDKHAVRTAVANGRQDLVESVETTNNPPPKVGGFDV